MHIRICEPDDYSEIYHLCAEHKKFARRVLRTRLSIEEVTRIIGPNVVIFGCFENKKLISFMATKKLHTVPAWYMILVVCKHGNPMFNAATNGIAELYNAAIKFWESEELFNFVYVQPSSFTKSANTRQHSIELQRYSVFTMYEIPKNKKTMYPFINSFVGNTISPVDQVVRWCYRNE
jgi:hypothetical protein